MAQHLLLAVAAVALLSVNADAQKKREIIPRDSITNKYCYQRISAELPASKAELRNKLSRWISQNYDTLKSKYTKLSEVGDSYTIHDREALPGRARKFVEYNLTVDLKEHRYRYTLTDLQYAAVGMYPLEDKMATDKRSDFEAMDTILRRIIASMEAALQSEW